MPYITKADLASHLYTENIDEITRGDDTLVTRAISAGISEAGSYLSRYDLAQLLGSPATPADENLKMKIQDLACWHLVKLANPNISLELLRTAYEDAITWFEKIMGGKMNPQGWPYHDTSTDPAPPAGDEIYGTSNLKRRNHY